MRAGLVDPNDFLLKYRYLLAAAAIVLNVAVSARTFYRVATYPRAPGKVTAVLGHPRRVQVAVESGTHPTTLEAQVAFADRDLRKGDTVGVLYAPDSPDVAELDTFSSLWGDLCLRFVFLLPALLLWLALGPRPPRST